MGYLGILSFTILVPKGQGHTHFNLRYLCNYWEFLDETYIFVFLIKLPF